MELPRLSDLFTVSGRFYRSVQVQQDWQHSPSLQSYLPTPTTHEVVQLILKNLADARGERAWAITGPFGTGKSAFVLFLADVLAHQPAQHPEALPYQQKSELLPTLFPLFLMGERGSLSDRLRDVLLGQVAMFSPEAVDLLAAEANIIDLYRKGLALIRSHGWDGLLLVIDEFGKFLEQAALRPDEQDIFALQVLAEEATRSVIPFVLITVQHSSLAEYLPLASHVQRTEWQKIQGRFKDITFFEPPTQLLSLVARSLTPIGSTDVTNAYQATIQNLIHRNGLAESARRFALEEVAPQLAPLHPLTALLLVTAFRSQLAQNERSLFAFLTSQEPYGFQHFLAESVYSTSSPLYPPDRLYDYLTTSLGGTIYLGERSYIWREIEQHLQRLPANTAPLVRRVVKLVGILTLFGNSIGVKADRETLFLAFHAEDSEALASALSQLELLQILLFRHLTQSFVLWEGVQIDLEAIAKEATLHLSGGSVAKRLAGFLPSDPLVARAHYVQSGTLRFFAVEYRDIDTPLEVPTIAHADGVISFVLTTSERERDDLMRRYEALTHTTESLWVVAFPPPLQRIDAPLKAAETWAWVQANDLHLAGDEGARREVAVRFRIAEEKLRHLLADTLDVPAISWWHGGEMYTHPSVRVFRHWLSELCDATFVQSPSLHNELLNRRKLSSAAVSARRNLLAAMFAHESQETLGFTKTPPEVSMYRSLLSAGGFHQQVDNYYQFQAPSGAWQPVWEAMETFLFETRYARRPVLDLYERLEAPPFGLRAGPLPVLLGVLLLVHRYQVALYEEGLFVRDLRPEVIERVTRNPQQFEIQYYALEDDTTEVYNRLYASISSLTLPALAATRSPLIDIVRALVTAVARLPHYTRTTRRLDDPRYLTVRDTILRAKDPYQLLHIDLPLALEISLTDPAFATTLEACLQSLVWAYPHLLDLIEQQVREVFQLYGSSAEVLLRLQERSRPLVRYATDIHLSLFVKEVEGLRLGTEWREALGRVIARGKAPLQWNDSDVAALKGYLLKLASDFERLEVLVLERDRTGVQPVLRIDFLNGSLEESRAIVVVPPGREHDVEVLLSQLRDTLGTVNQDQVQIAALARLVREVIERQTETSQKGR